MNRKEEQIREERTREAIRENLMGKSGKLGAVAIMLGSPILGQGGDDIMYLDDPWESYGDESMGTFDDDAYTTLLGWIWDGLREGINMEIKLSGFGPDQGDPRAFIMDGLKVSYQGYIVYHEEHGMLLAYAPKHPVAGEWKHHVNILYERAKKRRIAQEKVKEKAMVEESPKLAQKILNMLRLKWGD